MACTESRYGWTDDRVELLKKLWANGLSGSQIAHRLGGVTRCAVLGKVHRLGLLGRATRRATSRPPRMPRSYSQTVPPKKSAFAPVSRPPTQVQIVRRLIEQPAVEIPVALRIDLLDLRDGMCRWPLGDPKSDGFHFCGREKESGISYCGHHAVYAFKPAALRRK